MEVSKKFTAVIEYMGENRFLGYVPAIPAFPPTLESGIIETIQRLESQLKMLQEADLSEHPEYNLDIVLFFPRKGAGSNVDVPATNVNQAL